MKYNIIGDIHGRTCWRELVQDDSINIFVGDYFDPYHEIPFDSLLSNAREIIAYKQAHPQTVLLYGNHDLHYLTDRDRSSRYDIWHTAKIQSFFASNAQYFAGAAYAIGDDTLVTHAGVTREWYEREFGDYTGARPSEVAEEINSLWAHNKVEFCFNTHALNFADIYGESPTHSPMWIRPWVLIDHDLFAGTPYRQVFGHSQCDDITPVSDRLICVDCLGTVAGSYRIEL